MIPLEDMERANRLGERLARQANRRDVFRWFAFVAVVGFAVAAALSFQH